ncbi:TetR/AcrR family transcriptional regulator [Hydrogenothermus marinus]|uniref:TetR family transcriptional regulator n=1 Tax=Hydrogenothermus marinus TaxID=133270 RepID=A0A3M0BMI6_9AQUI|nr:TetR/AcrR family transcriptional regulator [Hydrogenothermus marinus]RMA97684.1 TetR family transcriptional regulator [Hydrogenothermus marinus]
MINDVEFEKLSTKEKIVKVAADIIVNEGLRRFTAKNIASRLGITDAAIFKHFPTMDDIILTLINEYVIRCSKSAEVGISQGKTVKEKLELVLKAHIQVLEETKGAVPILCFEFSRSENEKFTSILHSFVQNYKKTLAKVLEEGQKEGIVRQKSDPEEIAMFVLGSIQAKVFAKVIEKREGPVVPDPDSFIDEIFYGILER